ncbi:hypothetical protein Dimus_037051 [Dionaea muscipula]
MATYLCSTRFLLLLLLIAAVPIAYIVSVERAPPPTHVYYYHGGGLFRDSFQWDDLNRRFLVSFLEGGVGEIRVPDSYTPGIDVLEEITVVKDTHVAGNATTGISIDRRRNRLLVIYVDLFRNRYGALAAYDLSSWDRLFLTQLAGPGWFLSPPPSLSLSNHFLNFVYFPLQNFLYAFLLELLDLVQIETSTVESNSNEDPTY